MKQVKQVPDLNTDRILISLLSFLAFLLVIGRSTIRAFEHFDQKSIATLAEQIDVYNNPSGRHPVSKQELENSIAFFGLRERFIKPVISTISKPEERVNIFGINETVLIASFSLFCILIDVLLSYLFIRSFNFRNICQFRIMNFLWN